MSTYYQRTGFNGAAGVYGATVDEGNAGDNGAVDPTNPSDPLADLAGASFIVTGDGDTLMAAGRHVGLDTDPYLFFDTDAPDGLTIDQWDGQAPSHLRGMNAAGTSGWSASGGGYVKNIGAGLGTLVTVVWEYDDPANVDAVGRRKSHLKPGANAAAALAEASSSGGVRGGWHYDTATGNLNVSVPSGGNPGAPAFDGIAYVVAARSAIGILVATYDDHVRNNITIRNQRFSCWAARTAAPLGCAVAIQCGVGCVVEDNVFSDSGIHSISFGGRCEDNVMRNNVHVGANQGTIFVVYDPGGTTGGDAHIATGCVIDGDIFYCNSLLCHDGTLANRSGAVGAIILHAGAGNQIEDVTVRDVQIVEYSPSSGTPDIVTHFTLADTTPPGDDGSREVETNYKIKVLQTRKDIFTIDNGTFWPDQGVSCGAAFRQCRFRFNRAGQLTNGYAIDLRSLAGCIAFFGCEFIMNFNNTGRDMSLFGVGTNSMVICVNCSFLEYSAGPGAAFAFSIARMAATTASFRAYGCAFAFRNAGSGKRRVISGDSAAAFNNGGGLITLEDNLIYGISANEFGENATYNTQAEFESVFTRQVVTGTMPFADPTGATDLELIAALKTTRYVNSVRTLRGCNQAAWAGNFGGRQYPQLLGSGRISQKIGIGV